MLSKNTVLFKDNKQFLGEWSNFLGEETNIVSEKTMKALSLMKNPFYLTHLTFLPRA